MTLRQRLFLFIAISVAVCSLAVLLVNRYTMIHEVQNITQHDLVDMVNVATSFLEANPDLSKDKVDALINKKINIGSTGFMTIVDSKGTMVVHRKVQGKNWSKKPFIQQILSKKNGYIRFISPKTKTWKVAAFKYIPERDWIVVATNFEADALAAPVAKMMQRTFLFVTPLLALVLLALFYLVQRQVIQPLSALENLLSSVTHRVSEYSQQIFGSSQTVADGASSQAAAIEETSAAVNEIASMAKQTDENSTEVESCMARGEQVLDQTVTSIDQVTEAMDEIARTSAETQKIIKTIDEIAFQTNLLALNAAVEAARAGDAGAGFAVVADEVRNLAMRSAESAVSTSQLIEESVQRGQEGAELVKKAKETFAQVVENDKKVATFIAEISSAAQEQNMGISQVSSSMNEIDVVTQQNSASAEESSAACQELNGQVEDIEQGVADLRKLIG